MKKNNKHKEITTFLVGKVLFIQCGAIWSLKLRFSAFLIKTKKHVFLRVKNKTLILIFCHGFRYYHKYQSNSPFLII